MGDDGQRGGVFYGEFSLNNLSHMVNHPSTRVAPSNIVHSPTAGSMLGQRLRRWNNNEPALGDRTIFTGTGTDNQTS